MNHRKRTLETLLYGAPDRIPFAPGGPRESTLRTWNEQGLAPGANYLDIVYDHLDELRAEQGLPPGGFRPKQPVVQHGVSFRMIPAFEEKVLEHHDGHYIVQDWMGAITEISDEFDYTYLRLAKDFVTRKWHRFPVENREDWERMKERFDASDTARFPDDFAARCEAIRRRDYYVEVGFNGPFWQLREFCGMEGLCTLMLEQPDFVREMALFWRDFCLRVLEPILKEAPPDGIHISEDMAYKEHPMIGPEMTTDFCAPCYRAWVDEARRHGVQVFAIDSDGRVDALIPVWLDCGVNVVDPMEVAAGNDLQAIRETFGKQLAYRGGIDKRAIAAGGPSLDAALARVRPVADGGGYIPSCDHGVPPDISWPNFQDYCVKLARLTGWLK